MIHGHEIVKGKCGHVIAQCRCFAPNKPVRVVEELCNACRELEAAAVQPAPLAFRADVFYGFGVRL